MKQTVATDYSGHLHTYCTTPQREVAGAGGGTLKVVGNCAVPALNVFQLPYQM